MTDRFDKFTERARKVLQLAQEEAQRFNHNYISTEHILLGLVREGDGVAARVLNNLGVDLDKTRAAVEAITERGDRMVMGEIGLTPQAKRTIELAVDAARHLNHHYIGTEHLLLGLTHLDDDRTAQIFKSLSISAEKVRAQVIEVLKSSSGYGASSGKQTANRPFGRLLNRGKEARVSKEREAEVSFAFDKFTKRARRVLQLAQEEAQRFNHNYIGTEHILLGLVREGDGVAARVLNNLGIELHKVRSAVEFIIGRGDRMVMGEIGLTPRAKRVIELAVDEARRLNHKFIGTEHLLLGLVREGEGIAAGVLESLGVSLEKVRAQVIEVLKTLDDSAPAEDTSETEPSAPSGGEITTALTEQELQILTMRIGLAGGSQHSSEEVAQTFGMTTDEVRRVETRLLRMLPLAGPVMPPDTAMAEGDKGRGATVAVEQIRTMFDYSIWARDKMLGPIETLDETQLRATPESGVYGAVYDTLAHMAVSEWLWLQRCLGESPMKLPKGEDFANLRVLIDWWNEQHVTAVSYLSSITDDDLGQEVTYRSPDGKTRTRKVWHMLLQVPNHQIEHRSQLATMLGQMSVEVPPTDLVVYLSEKQL